MSFGSDYAWNDPVHRLLGESLFYFLAQVRPFDPEGIKRNVDRFLAERQPGSVRVFAVFGSNDLLIRAWLHPNAQSEFQTWLNEGLNCRVLYPFSVTKIDWRWSWGDAQEGTAKELLKDLDEKKIRAVQSGTNPDLLEELKTVKLVMERKVLDNSIRFFVAVTLGNVTQQTQDGVVKRIKAHLDGSSDIHCVSIYSGYGFCSILLKAQVLDYHGIPKVPNWIGTEFRDLGASTETFLVHSPTELAGDESIGRTTFQAIKGKNLFVGSIIPEVYGEVHDSLLSRAEEIQTFLVGIAHESYLKLRDKTLLHDYLLPYLRDDPADMARTIFTFCAELESFLRKRCEEFIGRSGADLRALCEKLGILKDRRRYFTLEQLLNLCSAAIRDRKSVV